MSNTEMAPTPAQPDPEAPREDAPLKGGSSQHAAGEPKKASGFHKPIIACLQLALAVTLFGLLAYLAQGVRDAAGTGGSSGNQTSGSSGSGGNSTGGGGGGSSGSSDTFNNSSLLNAGLNAAGVGLLLFGLIFAVLQAVTALGMWLQLAYHLPHVRHSSIVGPLKVTLAIGFIAMGFACRSINLGVPSGGDVQQHRILHAVEAFIIINWVFVLFVSLGSSSKISWDCENAEEHLLTRKHTLSYTQFFLSLILIGLLSSYFQQWTQGYTTGVTPTTDLMTGFAILFAVLQAVTGVTMMQQSGRGAPGQMGETVLGLLKVTNSFGVIAFGFACRTIYITSQSTASPHLIATEAFVIINFFYSLFLSHAITWWPTFEHLHFVNAIAIVGKAAPGIVFGILHVIFSVVLFGMIAAVLESVTGEAGNTQNNGLNAAGQWMILFGLLFSVMEFFAGLTMASLKRMNLLNGSAAGVTSKVTLAFGALALGFACRHINLGVPSGAADDKVMLVHAIESFIIINFFLTWLIDILNNKGKIEY